MKHTSKELKKQLESDGGLQAYEVNAVDSKYNFWQRDALNIELFTSGVLNQKINYIHNNPVRASFCKWPEEYHYSSALFMKMA